MDVDENKHSASVDEVISDVSDTANLVLLACFMSSLSVYVSIDSVCIACYLLSSLHIDTFELVCFII